MKTKIFLTGLLLSFVLVSRAQLTVDHLYTIDPPTNAFKLNNSGLKYFAEHRDMVQGSPTFFSITYFVLYNPDHSVFKTINVPQLNGKRADNISYVTETLFDTDTLIEYMLYFSNAGATPFDVAVLSENGSTLLYVDSATFTSGTSGDPYRGFVNQPIFPNGNQTKLYLWTDNYTTTTVYNLPGRLPCMECDGGVISAVDQPENPHKTTSTTFPNPSKEHFNIKYILPENAHFVFLEIYDIQGILVKKSKLNNRSNQTIVYNDELSSGQFIYRITADGVVVTSDKVVITK